MNERFRRIFSGKVVNKALTRDTGLDEFPRYVLEYLIDNYCRQESFEEDIKLVCEILRERYVYGAEGARIRSAIRERGEYSLLANLEARLVEAEDRYWGSLRALNQRYIHISTDLVRQYPMLLSGGMWGTITLTYDSTKVHRGTIRPYVLKEFTPFQITRIDLDEYIEKSAHFSGEEWCDIIINTFGLDPHHLSRREELLIAARAIPLVENNSNLIELGARETGKTYLLRNLSYYIHTLSGGSVSPASIFFNLATGRLGMVSTRDAIAFDEIANIEFTDPRALVSLMQNYMQDAKFTRGKRELLAFSSIILAGNIDVQGDMPHEKYYHLFEELPSFLQGLAFLDRLHAYIPGWEIPKLTPDSYSKDYGFVSDYFCEIMHLLRRREPICEHLNRFELVDTADTPQGVTGRDERAIRKNLCGLLTLLYPHGRVEEDELTELLLLCCELRQRVRDQLHLIAPGEYDRVKLGVKMLASGQILTPNLKDSYRRQRITLPEKPSVGEVVGLGILNGRGILLRFEIVANKGRGRIIPLGSIQRVMKESIDAAIGYIRANSIKLRIDPEFHKEYEISILATQMGIPKEGPSAGLPILAGLVSVLKGRPVRDDIALTGEITLKGRILGVGDIQEKLRVAYDAGVAEVFIPQENEKDVEFSPAYIRRGMKITLVSRVEEALERALLP